MGTSLRIAVAVGCGPSPGRVLVPAAMGRGAPLSATTATGDSHWGTGVGPASAYGTPSGQGGPGVQAGGRFDDRTVAPRIRHGASEPGTRWLRSLVSIVAITAG